MNANKKGVLNIEHTFYLSLFTECLYAALSLSETFVAVIK